MRNRRGFAVGASLGEVFLGATTSLDGKRVAYRALDSCLSIDVDAQFDFGISSLLRDIDLREDLVAVDLEISSKSDVLRFIDEIGFFGAKAERAEAVRSCCPAALLRDEAAA